MLRASTITLIFLFFLHNASAEKYNVIHVKGTIKVESSGAILKSGSVLNSDDKVIFGSKDAKAAVFSPGKGRFTLSPGSKSETVGSEFLAYVKQSLIPGKSALSTRAGETLKNVVDIKAYFESGPMLILGETEVKFSESAFPMNDNTFFFLRYHYQGEHVNKKLSYKGQTLVLDMEEILKVEEVVISKDEISGLSLHYYNAEEQTANELANVEEMAGMNKELFKEAVSPLISSLQAGKYEKGKIIDEVEGYLTEFFGRPDKVQLKEWVLTEFDL